MQNIKLRNLIGYLQEFPNVDTLLFTGGNSKNGPEYFFRKHIKDYGISLKLVSDEIPRIHQFKLPVMASQAKQSHPYERTIKTVSLTSSSGSANRAIGSMPLFKQLKQNNPKFTAFDFRVMQYREFF